MEDVSHWVFTICAGSLVCGVISALVPSKSFEKTIQLLLGLFMLFCFLTPISLDWQMPSVDISQAEERRLKVADSTGSLSQEILLDELARRAETECGTLMKKYGLTDSDYRLALSHDSLGVVTATLTVPERLQPHSTDIASQLGATLGITVDIALAAQPTGKE